MRVSFRELSLGIDVLELGRLNQTEHERGGGAAMIGAGEQPAALATRNPAQLTFGRTIAQPSAATLEERAFDSQHLLTTRISLRPRRFFWTWQRPCVFVKA
jgi:hypothetical protein